MQDLLLIGLTSGFLLTVFTVAYATKKFTKSKKSTIDYKVEYEKLVESGAGKTL